MSSRLTAAVLGSLLLTPGEVVGQSQAIPTAASPLIIGVALLYFVAVAGIAIWSARRTKNQEDFFIAGKSLGLFALTMTAMATTFSLFTFIGGPGFIYASGLGAMLYVLPAAVTNVLAAWVLAKRLRLLAEVRPILTIPEAIGTRFQSSLVQGWSALGLIVGVIGYTATNVLALGVVMDALFGFGLPTGIWVGTVIVMAYSASGGILAGVYTDVLQGVVMAVAAVLVFFYAMQSGGGMSEISTTIIQADPTWTSPWGTQTALGAMSLYFVFSVGVLGQPHVMHKFFMLKDPKKLKWYPLLVTLAMVVVILLMLGVGMAVKAMVVTGQMPPIDQPDATAPLFLLYHTPQLLAAIVFSAMAAAAMSTVDGTVNVGAAAITRDLPTALGIQVEDELRLGRISTIGLSFAAAGLAHLAHLQSGLVAVLGIFGYSVFAATLMPALAIGLNWGRVTRTAALSSIIAGLVLILGLEALRLTGIYLLPGGVSASAIALIGSIVTLLGVTLFTKGGERDELPADVRAALEL